MLKSKLLRSDNTHLNLNRAGRASLTRWICIVCCGISGAPFVKGSRLLADLKSFDMLPSKGPATGRPVEREGGYAAEAGDGVSDQVNAEVKAGQGYESC